MHEMRMLFLVRPGRQAAHLDEQASRVRGLRLLPVLISLQLCAVDAVLLRQKSAEAGVVSKQLQFDERAIDKKELPLQRLACHGQDAGRFFVQKIEQHFFKGRFIELRLQGRRRGGRCGPGWPGLQCR